MGLQRWPLNNFRGGLNTQDAFELDQGESRDLLNVVFTRRGAIQQRAGKTRWDTSGYPASKIAQHARLWYHGGTKHLLLSIDGSVYAANTSGALTLLFAGTAGTTWCFEQMKDSAGTDYIWMMNGTDAPKKWDGTTFSNWANSPPNGTMLRVYQNRMVVSGVAAHPNWIYWSDIYPSIDPEKPVTTYGNNWSVVGSAEDDLDPVTWLEIYNDYLLVFKKQSVWACNTIQEPGVTGGAQLRRVGTPGCEDRFQSCVTNGRCYYWNRTGVWSTEAIRAPAYECDKIRDYIGSNINYSQLSKVRLLATRDARVLVACPFGSSTNNDHVLELLTGIPYFGVGARRRGYIITSWTVHDYKASFLANFRSANTDQILAGDPVSFKVHELYKGTSDDGTAISAHWISGWKGIQEEEPLERVRRLNVELSGQCTVTLYQDFNDTPRFSKLLVTTQPSTDTTWDNGSNVWDDGGTWDVVSATQLLRARPEKRGRYHSIGFSNNVLNKTFTIFTAELAIRGGKEHTK